MTNKHDCRGCCSEHKCNHIKRDGCPCMICIVKGICGCLCMDYRKFAKVFYDSQLYEWIHEGE
jgi:hypothetical protein